MGGRLKVCAQRIRDEVSVGLWGGIFPEAGQHLMLKDLQRSGACAHKVPPCTMPATLFCVLFYSAGVPKAQRFSVPCETRCSQRGHHWQVLDRMTALAVVINELSLPADLLMMPCFITLGQKAGLTLEDAWAGGIPVCGRRSAAFAPPPRPCVPFAEVP